MGMLADFTAATREMLAVMGDEQQATIVRGVEPAVLLTLFVADDVQDVGQYGRVVSNKRIVQAMNIDWLFARGDVITVRGRSARVEDILNNDGIVNTAVLHG